MNVVVGLFMSGGQSMENISKNLKHGGLGIGGKSGKSGIVKGARVGNGTRDQ